MTRNLGRFHVLEELARGGTGVVYRAHDPVTGAEVAIKVLFAGRASQEPARRRFRREAEALAALDHPGIVRVREVGEDQGLPFLVMEWVPGDSLQQALERTGPLEPRRVAELGYRLAEALEHSHQRGVLHRDLKPANVMLDLHDRPRLTDFGLVRLLGDGQSVTRLSQSGQLLGTPGYWPPEQARGQLERIDARSDVYGLGATIYALLSGRPPHQGAGLGELLDLADTPPPALRSLRPEVPRELAAIVHRCLELEPQDRYPSAGALAEALEAWLAQPSRSPRLPRAPAVAAGLLFLGGLATAGILLRARSASKTPPPTAAPSSLGQEVPKLLEELLLRLERLDDVDVLRGPFERVLAEAPQQPLALAGLALIRLRHYEPGALGDMRRALRLAPRNPWVLKCIVRAQHEGCAGQLGDRMQFLDTLLAEWPDDLFGLYQRTSQAVTLGNMGLAQADADRALELAPERAVAWLASSRRRVPAEALADLAEGLRREPDHPALLLEQARLLQQAEDTDQAVRVLERLVELTPHHSAPAFNLGTLYVGAQRWDAAERALRLSLQRHETPMAWGWLGNLLWDHQQREAARDAYLSGLALAPADPVCNLGASQALLELGEFDEAVEAADVAVIAAPDRAWPRVLRARAQFARRRGEDALLDMQAAVRLGSASPDPEGDRHFFLEAAATVRDVQSALSIQRVSTAAEACLLGAILLDAEMALPAENAYARALSLAPDLPRALAGRGLARVIQGQDQRGQADLSRARELDPDGYWPRLAQLRAEGPLDSQDLDRLLALDANGTSLRHRGLLELRNGQEEPAEATFRLALQFRADPLRGLTAFYLGLRLMRREEFVGAEENLRLAARSLPRKGPALLFHGYTLTMLGRHPEALETLDRALDLDPHDAEVWITLSLLSRASGDLGRWVSSGRAATWLAPENVLAWYSFGSGLGESDAPQGALNAAARMIQLAPQDVRGWILHAKAARSLGMLLEARRSLDSALSLQETPDLFTRMVQGGILADEGRTAEARVLFEALRRRPDVGADTDLLARVEAALRELDD